MSDIVIARPSEILPNIIDPASTMIFKPGDEVVTIVVGEEEETYSVHKCVLIQHSRYFRGALTGDHFIESQSNRVVLPEADPRVFPFWLHWAYTGKLPTAVLDPTYNRHHPEQVRLPKLGRANVITTDTIRSSLTDMRTNATKNHSGPAQVEYETHPSWSIDRADKGHVLAYKVPQQERPSFINVMRLHRLADYLLSERCQNVIVDLVAELAVSHKVIPTANDIVELWDENHKTDHDALVSRERSHNLKDLIRDIVMTLNTGRMMMEEDDSYPETFLRELFVLMKNEDKAGRMQWRDSGSRCRVYHKHSEPGYCSGMNWIETKIVGTSSSAKCKLSDRSAWLNTYRPRSMSRDMLDGT